ncbi:MAG: arylsulfatase [Nitrospira sp. LK70]|nr:arylsulfatase [Nitrospira sp. LK70]
MKSTNKNVFLLALMVVGLTQVSTAQAAQPSPPPAKPNIVFILVDNVGWGDFSIYGGTTPTPRIDKLAGEGIRFNNYNVEGQCTPSRSAILTGRYAVRSGTYKVTFGLPYGLAPWEYTVANLLSDAGYATALYGKWHLGDVQGRLPSDKGFDEWWGIPNSWDEAGYASYPLFKESGMKPPMIWEGKKRQASTPAMPLDLAVRGVVDEKYIIPKTIDFIKRNAAAKKPFFVYVGYSEMHPPIVVNPGFDRKSEQRGGVYSDLIGEMDFRVGQILDAIKEAGIEGNTLVVLTSDNGAAPSLLVSQGGSSGPWRGDFMTPPFEGSYRTAGMVRWPGKVPAGVVTQEMLAAVDWLPTLASIAGASNLVPKDRPIDGIDASGFMLGKSQTTGRDSYVFFGNDGGLMSVKWKMYKMILRYSKGLEDPIVTPQFPMFYDLSSDPHEDFNLFATKLDNGWMLFPVLREIGKYERSLKEYPNIKPGEDFKGY